jgi:hypothetical protein
MKRLLPVILLLFLFLSCNKKSESDFIWERSYGTGNALFIQTSPDSGFVACGKADGKPYFLRVDKDRSIITDFKADYPGQFSSAWFDTTGYFVSGSSGGKMLLMGYSPKGEKVWENSLDAGFKIDITNLFFTGNGSFLAIGSPDPDSSAYSSSGLFFVSFDKSGHIITQKKLPESSFISANKAIVDNSGNVFLALTRKPAYAKTKACVAKYDNTFQKLWETELYTNPEFGAVSRSIKSDDAGNIYVGGNTELSTKDGKSNNSFLASLSNNGTIRWKKYLEGSNKGSALIFGTSGNLMMLNKNCFIINITNPSDGTDAGRIQLLSVCNSENTDAFGSDIGINFDKNLLVAGSIGGSFYLALKSSQ